MWKNLFDTCVVWSCVTRCRCGTTSSTLFTVYANASLPDISAIGWSTYIGREEIGRVYLPTQQSVHTAQSLCRTMFHADGVTGVENGDDSVSVSKSRSNPNPGKADCLIASQNSY
jgi:hypothetical protein